MTDAVCPHEKDGCAGPDSEAVGHRCFDCAQTLADAERARIQDRIDTVCGLDCHDVTGRTVASALADRPQFEVWKRGSDGRKLTHAPWTDDDRTTAERADPASTDPRYSWSDADRWTGIDEVREWWGMVPDIEGPSFVLQRDGEEYDPDLGADPFVLVDCDDAVREDGTLDPTVAAVVGYFGLTWGELSASGEGAHFVYRGTLPPTLQDKKIPVGDDGAKIEFYDGNHVIAMTGDHIRGTPEDVELVADGAFEEFIAEFDVESEEQNEEYGGFAERADPPDDLPKCYAAALQARNEWTEAGSNLTAQRVSFLPAALGFAAGYSVDEVTAHFEAFSGEGDLAFDPEITAYQLNQIREKGYSAPNARTLDRAGILPAPICAPDCPIHNDGEGRTTDSADDEAVAIVPNSPRARAAANGWRWHRTATTETGPIDGEAAADAAQQDLWDRTEDEIRDAMKHHRQVLLDVIMGGGKTFGAFKLAAELDVDLAYFAPRKELYRQAVEYATENGIPESECYVLPSIFQHCPTFTGEYGEEAQQRIKRLYFLGMKPKTIHNLLADDLACKNKGKCQYEHQCDYDPDDYQVLIGHHTHAHLPHVTKGRVPVVDEDPTDAFTQRIGGETLIQAVNTFLGFRNSPPFDGWQDLLDNRRDPDRLAAGLEWYKTTNDGEGFDFEPDERNVLDHEDDGYHAYAPHAVYAILNTTPMDNDEDEAYPFEHAYLSGMSAEARFFTTSEARSEYFVEFEEPPDLTYANGVIGLDGTPLIEDEAGKDRPAEWQKALGRPLDHRRVLDDDERREHLRDRGYVFVQSSPHIRPYSSGRYNDAQRDGALLATVRDEYGDGDPPLVFTDKKVEDEYRAGGFVERGLTKTFDHPGNLRGSNEYATERLLVHLGSSHHGDHELRRRAARLGETVPMDPEGKGVERDYGETGNAVLQQMRDNQVAQNCLRVGRDGKGALVVLDTCAFPEWLPAEAPLMDVSLWSKGERQVRDAWGEFEEPTAKEIAADNRVTIGERQTRRVLSQFADRQLVEQHDDAEDGRRTLWTDAGLSEIGEAEASDTEVPEVDLDAIGEIREERRDNSDEVDRDWEVADISRMELLIRRMSGRSRGSSASEEPVYAPPIEAFEGTIEEGDSTLHGG